MFKVIFQCVGIIGAWAAGAWLSLFLLSLGGVGVPDTSMSGIVAFGAVAFATSLGMEVRDWMRFNRIIVTKR